MTDCSSDNYITILMQNPFKKANSEVSRAKATLQKKRSIPLRILPVNVTKSAVSCRLGHIYWENP